MTVANPGGRAATHDQRLFPDTLWSVIRQAKIEGEPALSELCVTYQGPLLRYLRNLGYDQDSAADHLQGFFEQLFRRRFLENLGSEKGRFRTFLICSLKNYLRDHHDRKSAAKRGGGGYIGSLEETTEDGGPIHQPAWDGPAPDVEFDRAWARHLLARVMKQLESECEQAGKAPLFLAVCPNLQAEVGAPSYEQIGQRLGISEGAVKVAVHRLKGRLAVLVRTEIMRTVGGDQEWQEEMRYLMGLFG